MEIITGNAQQINSSCTNGWAVGHMQEGLAHSADLEIKLWHYDKPFDYDQKTFAGVEFITIYGGVLRFELELPNGEKLEITLRGDRHEFIILPPGTKKRVIVKEVPAFGDTIRWPSHPDASQVIGK
ncbi:MAG: hypothetical protein AAB584_00450 [Patescibacteria group bacterium]